jgi:hypothetical protein
LWLGIGGVYYGKRTIEKPMSTSGCPNSNSTMQAGLVYYSTKEPSTEPYQYVLFISAIYKNLKVTNFKIFMF